MSNNHLMYVPNGQIIYIPNCHKLYQWSYIKHTNGHKIYQMTIKYIKQAQNIPNRHKIYQTGTKYTKQAQNIPNRHKIYQIGIKYTNIFRCKTLQNIPKLGFFGQNICHPATLA
jgi:ribosomal protein S8